MKVWIVEIRTSGNDWEPYGGAEAYTLRTDAADDLKRCRRNSHPDDKYRIARYERATPRGGE